MQLPCKRCIPLAFAALTLVFADAGALPTQDKKWHESENALVYHVSNGQGSVSTTDKSPAFLQHKWCGHKGCTVFSWDAQQGSSVPGCPSILCPPSSGSDDELTPPDDTVPPIVPGDSDEDTNVPSVPGDTDGDTNVPSVPGDTDEDTSVPSVPDDSEGDPNIPSVPDDSEGDPNIPSVPDDSEGDPNTPSVPDDSMVAQVVALVNEARAQAGLNPVAVDSRVQQAAQVRAAEQAQLFSHTRPDGTSCFTALSQAGVSYRGAGENIAYGQRSAQAVMQAWMNSEGHRANILNGKFTTIGVGYTVIDGVPYWAQLFTY